MSIHETDNPSKPDCGGWFRTPNSDIERIAEIGPTAYAVLSCLRRYADADGKCYPSQTTIAERIGTRGRAVRAAIAVLRDAGLVMVDERIGSDGGRTSNMYTLTTIPPISPRSENAGGTAENHPTPRFQEASPPGEKLPKKEDQIEQDISCPGNRDEVKPERRQKEPTHTADDMATAQWMWQRILEMQPGRKPPKLATWADAIRLMRERDKRTHKDIRELFERVQADPFWRVNILSPDKLRAKWDDLQLKLGTRRDGGQRQDAPKWAPPTVYNPSG